MTCSLLINFRSCLFCFFVVFVSGIETILSNFLSPHSHWRPAACERSLQPSSFWVLIVLIFIFRTPETLTVVYAYMIKDPKCSETDSLSLLAVSSRGGVSCDEAAKAPMVQPGMAQLLHQD